MVLFISIILLLSSAVRSFATPAIRARAPPFSLPAIHNDNFSRNGKAALLKAYAKFGLKSTPDRELLSNSSVVATPIPLDIQYLCPVTIGGQTLNLDFDTGSADLWVFSDLLPQKSQTGHTIFSPNKSSTFHSLPGATWKITYDDGSRASGIVGTDTVTIGTTTVQSQAVEVAQNVSVSFVAGSADGLVGLAFSSMNRVKPDQQKTFIENAAPYLDSPIFAAYLPREASGAYDFGALNHSRYTGTIQTTKVDNTTGYWNFTSSNFSVGDKTFPHPSGCAVADTGTTLILMPDSAVSTYYTNVTGYDIYQGLSIFPCNATLPTLSLEIGTAGFAEIPAEYMNYAPLDNTGIICIGSLQSSLDLPFSIYGDIFFNAVYAVFNLSGPTFGFAPAVPPTPVT